MEKALETLSAATLRNLLITEVNKFIAALEHGSTDELQHMKLRLRKITDLIREKEKAEIIPLVWGKNSTQPPSNSQSDTTNESLSDAQTA